jgi:hypothetical protein
MPSAAKRPAKKPAAVRSHARPATRPGARPSHHGKSARPVVKPAVKPAAAKMATQKVIAKVIAKALPPGKAVLGKPSPAPAKPPGSRAPGVFETKVLTALKRHGGAAVSFATSPDHIKAAFKRSFVEGWATGTVDSASLTPSGEKVLERLKPEIRAFPAPTLRNRLNDALFRNQNKATAAAPPAANDAAKEADDEDEAEEAADDEAESDVEKAA